MASARKSNIELLRILAMAAVIIVHLDGASLGLPTPGSLKAVTASDAWRIVVESITIVGVNCFTLISGYFGIRARVKGFVMFTLMCIFYSVGIYSIASALTPALWSWNAWIESWMVYTHNDLWYVPAYMLLYLLSPMLNSAVDSLSRRQFGLWLGLFVAANVWCGWLWGAGFNPTGYTVVQLIMMYLIGRYIAITERDSSDKTVRKPLALYGILTVLTALIAVWMKPGMVYAYNSPWVIGASVALFITFSRLQLTSPLVNELARGAFAAYLIHKNPIVWREIVRPTAVDVWEQNSLLLYSVFTLCFTSVIYMASCIIDSFRAFLFRKIETLIDDKIKIKT